MTETGDLMCRRGQVRIRPLYCNCTQGRHPVLSKTKKRAFEDIMR